MAQLCRNEAELRALDTSVLLISFGTADGTKEWLDEVCPNFPALIDAGRDVYRAYELEQSLWGSWNLKTLVYYLRAFAQGRKWRSIKGDSTQLAGDFIVNPDGTFLLEYRSEDATDRPPVADILALLRKAATQKPAA